MLAVAGYRYGKKLSTAGARRSARACPASNSRPRPVRGRHGDVIPNAVGWEELLAEPGPLEFDRLPSRTRCTCCSPRAPPGCRRRSCMSRRHPPRAPEEPRIQLGPPAGDRLLWFTTTAWMMWNALASVLLLRASIVMIDGNPAYPDLSFQWQLTEETRDVLRAQPRVHDGLPQGGPRAGAASISRPSAWSAPRAPRCHSRATSGCTGSSGPEVNVNEGIGGTDVCTGLVQGYPLVPV